MATNTNLEIMQQDDVTYEVTVKDEGGNVSIKSIEKSIYTYSDDKKTVTEMANGKVLRKYTFTNQYRIY